MKQENITRILAEILVSTAVPQLRVGRSQKVEVG
jgi:hypothetical protein